MPRSSRHKSSKHSSRDARDYSDSEKDSSSKDRKSRDESSAKVSKEYASGEKRKLDSKDNNADFIEDYSTSKWRRERVDEGNDRWNGGDDDRGEGAKKLKDKSSESKSKRRDDSAGAYGESDEIVKMSNGKTEGKHRESSSKKEGREGGGEREREKEKERDRRGKEGKTEKLIDVDDLRTMKQASEKTELIARDSLLSPEMDSLPERRMRKKRDDFSDGDKNHEDFGTNNDRRLSSREDVSKDARPKEEKHKEERYRDKYLEDVERESRHRDYKQRDERVGKDHTSNKSGEKNSRDDKDSAEIRPKKYKLQDGDRVRERDHDHGRDGDFDSARDDDRESYKRERDRDRDWDRNRDRDRDRDRERERERDRDRNIDYDVVPIDGRNARCKDSRGRKRSPDDNDDYADTKSRGVKTAYLDMEKRSMSSRIESDADRGKSQSRQVHFDNNAGSNRRTSPNTSSIGAADDFRQLKQEDIKYKDTVIENRSSKLVSPRDVTGVAGASERNSKYRSGEKLSKMDEGHVGELSIERSSSSKASPMGLVDRSPSSTSVERRYTNKAGVRRNLDIEDSGRRTNASMASRDLSSADDRLDRDLPLEKSLMDDSASVDSSFHNRTSQTHIPPQSFRGRVGSPSFMGSIEEDARVSAGSWYKRSAGQGNAWRGAPNWSSPMPNGYIPFQHGPHHGAFQAMLPQFPSPPLFGVRPYHISDADRFGSHMRPLGWQNMMDSSVPAHMHGWDGNNSVFRDEPHVYGGPDWDQTRHPMNGRGWEGQNGDMNLGTPLTSLKVDCPVQEDVTVQRSFKEGNQAKAADTKTSVAPLANDSYITSPETNLEKIPDPPESLNGENDRPYDAYLSQLDISTELVDPELYDQFARLLNIKQSVTAMEDATMLVDLKDGARAVPKNSSILLSSWLFPTSDSAFQRAMGIYKRQRASMGGLPFANGGIIDAILESKMEEEAPPNNKAIPEEPVDEMLDMNSKATKVVTVANVGEPEVSEVVPIKEADAELKLESTDEGVIGPTGSEIEVVPYKPVSSEDDKAEIVSSPLCLVDVANTTKGDNGETETQGRGTLNNREEEGQGLCVKQGSPNESESVILSRIHHSRESTH